MRTNFSECFHIIVEQSTWRYEEEIKLAKLHCYFKNSKGKI